MTYRLHYAPDNASLIIRLALEELGLAYDAVLVERSKDAQRAPAYLAINPNGLIPTLETPQGAVFETGAILLWLSEQHNALAPAPQSRQRGEFLKWLFFISNTVHTEMRMMFYPDKYIGADLADCTKLRRGLQVSLKAHLSKLDALAGEGHSWFNSATVTVLDLYVVTLLRWMALYPASSTKWFSLNETPHLHALATRIELRSSVARAIKAEGLGATPFSKPRYATPPEGSAT
ncbi:glutathione S-transferase family protein [Lentibacter algarum]|uniref:glutathione S-transferase family protein n=1 Tax=Lentibacter algarum TaxID=576131 RepID=UPI001C071EB8|nr:glutathione S-transferase family protein [Lentibacter algarum]MBU2980846.1 glutathione S-transferase family protein [Lentibacter algarum]